MDQSRALFRGLAAFVAVAGLCACAEDDAGLPKPPAYAEWSRPASLAGPAGRTLAPRPDSPQYLRSWGLILTDAEPAYRQGVTGAGVTVAVIDTGLRLAPEKVSKRASPDSTDLIAPRTADGPDARHGGEIAQGLDSALDGQGVVGAAYGATLLSIRADMDGSCVQACRFRTADLARGIDYALAHGVRLITLAVEGEHRLGDAFEAALARAQAAGAVVVIAAGNEGSRDPTWPARYAEDTRFARAVIAVGAAGPSGRMARWSNRAGAAHDRYLLAPGERIVADCDDKVCSLISGTSFSVPYVAGAVALVMQSRPDLSAQDAAEVVLRSARPNSDQPAPSISGHGMLDIGRALELAQQGRG